MKRSLISFQGHPCSSIFHVDQKTGRLFCDEDPEPLELGTAAFEVLVYLIKNSDRAVSAEELLKTVLAGVSSSDRAVKAAIREIRVALGESHRDQLSIKTRPGLGYQFIADLAATDFLPPSMKSDRRRRN